MEFISILKERNEAMFWFGLANFAATLIFVVLSFIKPIEFGGTNAWFKPIKFALSTAILTWSMGWYIGYLEPSKGISIFNWIIIITLAFEVLYIAWQAARGQASHFNLSTPFHTTMYSLMAIAATAATLAVGYIGILFFAQQFPDLRIHYLWAIRLGLILFVFFSFEGFVMGSKLTHTIGGPDGGPALPFLNWSTKFGDPRVAHFIGMHALQVLPLVAFYILKDIKWTIAGFIIYSLIAFFVLFQALSSRPLIKY